MAGHVCCVFVLFVVHSSMGWLVGWVSDLLFDPFSSILQVSQVKPLLRCLVGDRHVLSLLPGPLLFSVS